MPNLLVISRFLRRIVLSAQITDTAATFVKEYLKGYLSDEILNDYNYMGAATEGPMKGKKGKRKGLEVGNAIATALKYVPSSEDKTKVLEDLAFSFTKPTKSQEGYYSKTGSEIKANLVSIAEKKLDLGKKAALRIISPGGTAWNEEDTENFEILREDFIRNIVVYLEKGFDLYLKEIIRGTKKFEKLPEEKGSIEEGPTIYPKELMTQFEEFAESQKGSEQDKAIGTLGFSVDTLKKFIKESPKIKEKEFYMKVLEDNILKAGPSGGKERGLQGYKSYVDIAEELNFDDPKEKGRKRVEFVAKSFAKLINKLRSERGLKPLTKKAFPYRIIRK